MTQTLNSLGNLSNQGSTVGLHPYNDTLRRATYISNRLNAQGVRNLGKFIHCKSIKSFGITLHS